MKLKSRKALGKQAPCPKCKKPFLVKELPSDAVEDYEVDEYDTGDPTVDHDVEYYDDDAHDDYEDFDDEPRRRSKKRPSKKRRKKKANWVKPTLIISGSVVGVALLGLGIWLVWGMFNKKLELAWLPPDASTISVKRPASTWNRSILGTRYDSEKANLILEKERELWGVTQRDIVSITSGGNRSGENITVVRASADLVPETILKNAANYEKADHNGNTYYRVGAVVLFFPDDRTAVIGSEDSVKKAIDRGPEPAKREDLDFVNASYENVAVSTSNSSRFGRLGFISEARPAVVGDFTLKDFRGKSHSLSDFRKQKIVVVAFLGTECPLAKLYGPRLAKLHAEFSKKGVAFVGINANSHDSITEIAAYARIHKLDFPVLKDLGNKVADKMGAVRTPEVFVLDEKRTVRYWGRIDDQYGVGYLRDEPTRHDLRVAIEELLAGKPVSQAVAKAEGCYIGRVLTPKANSPVTYTQHIAPLLQKRCVECHREGDIAPFALTKYEEVAGWAETIEEVVFDRRMPPWHADPKHGEFANDRSLSAAEKKLIQTWVANGAPRGPGKPDVAPLKLTKGWQLPQKPDVVIEMANRDFTVPAEGVYTRTGVRRGVQYKHFHSEYVFKQDRWIKMAEAVPGNRAVVHHILVIVRPPGRRKAGVGGGEFLVAYRTVKVTAATRLDAVFPLANQSPKTLPDSWLKDYDSTKQTYELFVPKNYSDRKSWPVFLFISPSDSAMGWRSLQDLCTKNGIIFAGPHAAGNRCPIRKRVRIVLDVLDELRRGYNIDPDRCYIGGFSGGGRVACAIGFALPELFGGVVPICAAGDLRSESWLRQRVIDRVSVAHVTGESDFNRGEVERYRGPMLKDVGVRSRVWTIPRMGHSVPTGAAWRPVWTWLEAGVARRRAYAKKYPASRTDRSSTANREAFAEALLSEAESRLKSPKLLYSGLRQLVGIRTRWPDTDAAKKAFRLLQSYEAREKRPWEKDDIAEQHRFLFARAKALDAYATGPLPRQYAAVRDRMLQSTIQLWETLAADSGHPDSARMAKERIPRLKAELKE
eukprot:g26590.t1